MLKPILARSEAFFHWLIEYRSLTIKYRSGLPISMEVCSLEVPHLNSNDMTKGTTLNFEVVGTYAGTMTYLDSNSSILVLPYDGVFATSAAWLLQ
jgi:hypothetical protein